MPAHKSSRRHLRRAFNTCEKVLALPLEVPRPLSYALAHVPAGHSDAPTSVPVSGIYLFVTSENV